MPQVVLLPSSLADSQVDSAGGITKTGLMEAELTRIREGMSNNVVTDAWPEFHPDTTEAKAPTTRVHPYSDTRLCSASMTGITVEADRLGMAVHPTLNTSLPNASNEHERCKVQDQQIRCLDRITLVRVMDSNKGTRRLMCTTKKTK